VDFGLAVNLPRERGTPPGGNPNPARKDDGSDLVLSRGIAKGMDFWRPSGFVKLPSPMILNEELLSGQAFDGWA
jgi:hypothetical protein